MKMFRSIVFPRQIVWTAIVAALLFIFRPTTSFAPPLRNHGWGARPFGQIQVCTPPPANMVGWWPGDGNTTDVQNGNNVTFPGSGTFGSGEVAQAFSFDGSGYATAGNPANLNITGNQVTIDGWVNPSVDMTNEAIFFGKSADGLLQYFLEWTSGVLAGRVNNGDTEATFTPPTGVWTHLAMVYNGAATPSVTIYANGVALASTVPAATSGNIIGTAAPFTIGGRGDGRDFNGLIDEVEVFNRALDATEVAALYNAGSAGKCVPSLQLTAAASRKHHQDLSVPIDAGTFDVNLPLTGEPGVECRTGGANQDHKLVFTFTHHVVSGGASFTGIGSISGGATFPDNTMVVDLTGVADGQQITVTLNGVTDAFGQVLPATAVKMNVLLGDTTANKAVNSSDISQTKSQSGVGVSAANFREDVTANGQINSSDVSQVKARSGHGVP